MKCGLWTVRLWYVYKISSQILIFHGWKHIKSVQFICEYCKLNNIVNISSEIWTYVTVAEARTVYCYFMPHSVVLFTGQRYLVAPRELSVDRDVVLTQWWERSMRREESGGWESLRTYLPGMRLLSFILD